ncbi:MAG: hypothetical protein H6850_02280 [Alphaproteobacteria bacterium]|nr:MAG: hypothetical protein H6850_02280 [Alphaproteobacteria bacterium]
MQFRLRSAQDPNKFFCVYIVSEEKRDYSWCEGYNVPDINTLSQNLALVPANYEYSPHSTLIIVSPEEALTFDHFIYIVKDALEYNLHVTFSGAKKNDCFCIPPASICACISDILHAEECFKQFLFGTVVYIKDRCLSNEEKQLLAQCATDYQFTIHYARGEEYISTRRYKKKAHPKKTWSEWRDCEDHFKSWKTPCDDQPEYTYDEGKSHHHRKKVACSTKCYDDCLGEKWVKEPLHMGHEGYDHDEEGDCFASEHCYDAPKNPDDCGLYTHHKGCHKPKSSHYDYDEGNEFYPSEGGYNEGRKNWFSNCSNGKCSTGRKSKKHRY